MLRGDVTSFSKNREGLQRADIFQKFMTKLLEHPQVKPLLSDEHFSVDGTLIERNRCEGATLGLLTLVDGSALPAAQLGFLARPAGARVVACNYSASCRSERMP